MDPGCLVSHVEISSAEIYTIPARDRGSVGPNTPQLGGGWAQALGKHPCLCTQSCNRLGTAAVEPDSIILRKATKNHLYRLGILYITVIQEKNHGVQDLRLSCTS